MAEISSPRERACNARREKSFGGEQFLLSDAQALRLENQIKRGEIDKIFESGSSESAQGSDLGVVRVVSHDGGQCREERVGNETKNVD